MPQAASKLDDPQWRRQRARNAALARTTVDAHIRALVDAAPPLTSEQRSRLAGLLAPSASAAGEPRDAA